MGWIADLLQEIPSAAHYRIKLEQLASEHDALQSENAVLKSKLLAAEEKIGDLEKQLDKSHGKLHLEKNVKERPVSPALLDSMTTDLQRIGTQLILHFAKPDWTYAQRLETYPALKDAWLYKPPQDQSLRVKKQAESGPRPAQAPRDPR